MKQPAIRRGICLLLLVLLMPLLCGCSSKQENRPAAVLDRAGSNLSVYFFAAGKADAILLMTDQGTVLIDCGQKGFGQTILDTLSEKGISFLDYLIITHFDRDHIGGAAKVINNISVGTVLQSNYLKDSEEVDKYFRALSKAGLEPVTVREDYRFTIDGVDFTVNPSILLDYKDDDSNNSSLIVTVRNGGHTFLFMGDAQTERLAEYLDASPVDCDLIKIPHHGGEDERMDELIAATKPEYAVITCSDEEPDTTATRMLLDKAGISVFLTAKAPVLVQSDGKQLNVAYA